MLILADEPLRVLATLIIEKLGTTSTDARIVADHLVDANLKGHDSHGIIMLPEYVRCAKSKRMDPMAHISIERDEGNMLTINANAGFGQVAGLEATNLAISRAHQKGAAISALKNAFHLGRIGAYGELCARHDLVSVAFVNVVGRRPSMSPYGGREPKLHTNPFCCVIPTNNRQKPIVLDMATSTVALGKVRRAQTRNEALPDGALLDSNGRPTNDPSVIYPEQTGSLTPFGQHKGYGLGVVCEVLGGALAGNWTADPITETKGTIINNMLSLIFRTDCLGDPNRFTKEVEDVARRLRETRPAEGFNSVVLPGDPERISEVERKSGGIPIGQKEWATVRRAALAAGIKDRSLMSACVL